MMGWEESKWRIKMGPYDWPMEMKKRRFFQDYAMQRKNMNTI